ncbi:TMV resistance protein N-like protein [Tanacetum coccineum]
MLSSRTNYADSKWCLNELCEMMHLEQMNDQRVVLPVFLDVKKSYVGTQQGSYKKHFETLQEKFDEGTVQTMAANSYKKPGQLPGGLHLQDDANGDEGTLVEPSLWKLLKNVGSMDVADDRNRIVAICGPAGIEEQLKILGINRAIFGRGSRIIVTTRDASFLGRIKPDATYEPRLLDETESLEVFCMDAFQQKKPKEGYEEVSWEAVRWGAGRPGALKVAADRLRCFDNVQHWKWALKGLMHEYSSR